MSIVREIEIISAYYGCNTIAAVNVTESVRKLVAQNESEDETVRIPVSPMTFSIEDPCPGHKKSLTVKYRVIGRKADMIVKSAVDGENVVIVLYEPEFTVESAVYGTNNIWKDITIDFQNYLSDPLNPTTITVDQHFTNQFLWGHDIAPGVVKTLTLEVRKANDSQGQGSVVICANDGDEFDIAVLCH